MPPWPWRGRDEKIGEAPNIRSLKVLREGSTHQIRTELVKMHKRMRHLQGHRLAELGQAAGFPQTTVDAAKRVAKWCKACRHTERLGGDAPVSIMVVA